MSTSAEHPAYDGAKFFYVKECIELLEKHKKGAGIEALRESLDGGFLSTFHSLFINKFVYKEYNWAHEIYRSEEGGEEITWKKKQIIIINDDAYYLYMFKHCAELAYEEIPLLKEIIPIENWIQSGEFMGEKGDVPINGYRIHEDVVKFLIIYSLVTNHDFLYDFDHILINHSRLDNC